MSVLHRRAPHEAVLLAALLRDTKPTTDGRSKRHPGEAANHTQRLKYPVISSFSIFSSPRAG